MPVQLEPPGGQSDEPRIEVIPLIDIMFFLLAAFMLVSLSMVNLNSVEVELPTATTAAEDDGNDLLSLTIDANGLLFLEGEPLGGRELRDTLSKLKQENPGARILLSADRAATYEDVVRGLDLARQAGIEDVAFELSLQTISEAQ